MSCRRSLLIVSGMTMTRESPCAAANAASPMPVLPLVGSMSRVSAFRTPRASASRSISAAALSLTEPVGFIDSTLARISAPGAYAFAMLRRATSGVRPAASAIEEKNITIPPEQIKISFSNPPGFAFAATLPVRFYRFSRRGKTPPYPRFRPLRKEKIQTGGVCAFFGYSNLS